MVSDKGELNHTLDETLMQLQKGDQNRKKPQKQAANQALHSRPNVVRPQRERTVTPRSRLPKQDTIFWFGDNDSFPNPVGSRLIVVSLLV